MPCRCNKAFLSNCPLHQLNRPYRGMTLASCNRHKALNWSPLASSVTLPGPEDTQVSHDVFVFFLNVVLSAKQGYSHPAYSCLFCSLEQTPAPAQEKKKTGVPPTPPVNHLALSCPENLCENGTHANLNILFEKKKAARWKTGKRRKNKKMIMN